ncbi:MAG: MFS transporter [Bryobacteraceae bacterium]|nr:MFS transporter [Bryobacteraceae bacterium]
MPFSVSARLAGMMFLTYLIWGSWYMTVNTYLTATLKFTGTQAGAVFGTTALASMISPLIVGLVADRFFATERVLSALFFAGAAVLWAIPEATSFSAVYSLMLLYCLIFFPAIPLTNSLAMRQMTDAQRQFPPIRIFAPLGWILISVIVSYLKIEAAPTPFRIASVCSLLMGAYCLILPHTPPGGAQGVTTWRTLLGLDALVLLKDRAYSVFLIASVLACIPLTFYFSFTNTYLNAVGVANAAGKMSLGQVSEVLMTLAMPWVFARISVKNVLLIGLAAWALRYVLLAFGNAEGGVWMFYAAILLHGICFTFFFFTGSLYTDATAPPALRNTAQGLLTLVTYGFGMFLGSFLSGTAVDLFTTTVNGVEQRNWMGFWLTSAAGAGGIALMLLLVFRGGDKTAK